MATERSEFVEQIKNAGDRLLKLPPARDELLKLLEELEGILSKVEQAPSLTIQEALLPSMKALISDHVLKNSDSDIRITVAVCFNEIIRITAPDSPYEDGRMKEIFELIVASFDKLSLLSGISYSKAVSIIKNVAKVRSCVMMLDIECDNLIIEIFKQFKRNLRSDHPPSVFSAMEDIMSLIIDESEDIPLELLKALLDFVYKEKEGNLQNTTPVSWRLGVKVMARSSKKIKPYFIAAIKSGDIRKDDYAPLIYSILEVDFDMEQNHVADSTKQAVAKESADDTLSPGDARKSGAATAKPVLSSTTTMEDQDATIIQKPSKASGNDKQSNASDNADVKAESQKDNERSFPIEGREAPSRKSPPNPLGCSKKSSAVAMKNERTPKDVLPRKDNEILTKYEEKNYQGASVRLNQNGKKLGRTKKGGGGGSGNKGLPSNLGRSPSDKERNGFDETEKKVLRRKRDQMQDEVFETPFGIKKYKEDIVGCKLKVWWPKDKAYYEGRITSYSPTTRKHRVEYDDGDVEVLNLITEQFEFIGDEIAIINRKVDVKPHLSSNELRAKQDHSVNKTETPKTASKDNYGT